MKDYQIQSVWDWVTRLWHWSLAIVVIIAWLLGQFRNFDIIVWHFYIGYCVCALLIFRGGWGFIGPQTVRFTTLLQSMILLPGYLSGLFKRHPSGAQGHSPLGSLATITLLLALTCQVLTGLFSEDTDLFSGGPLVAQVSSSVISTATYLHILGAKVLLVLFICHLLAMFFYRVWKKEDLIKPMFTGKKQVKRNA